MSEFKGISRRTVLRSAAAAAAGALVAPGILRGAEQAPIKLGLLQPMTGFLAQAGELAKIGAEYAVQEINDAGGIMSMDGAMIELVVGDSQSNPEAGAQATEKLNEEGVLAIGGGFASGITLTATQTAARYSLPFLVDSATADSITQRGLANTFRLGPNFTMATNVALQNLTTLNESAGNPAKTVALVHEDGLFGSSLAKIMRERLPGMGFEIVETISHPTPARDMSNVVLRLRSLKPDLVIPSNYYNEFVLMARTMQQQRVKPMGIYAIFGGAASSYQFVAEYPKAAEGIMDCNHWGDPANPVDGQLKAAVEAQGKYYAYNTPINYSVVKVLAQALEMAGSRDREAVTEALRNGEFQSGVMPYGTTKFGEDGQNISALPLNTQIQDGAINVIYPDQYRQADPIFPVNA